MASCICGKFCPQTRFYLCKAQIIQKNYHIHPTSKVCWCHQISSTCMAFMHLHGQIHTWNNVYPFEIWYCCNLSFHSSSLSIFFGWTTFNHSFPSDPSLISVPFHTCPVDPPFPSSTLFPICPSPLPFFFPYPRGGPWYHPPFQFSRDPHIM